jgi:hypothetical protein
MSRIDRLVRRLSWGFVLIALCTCASAQMTLEIIPASPRYEEPVYARIVPGRGSGFYVFGAKLSMSGTGITIEPDYIIEIGGGGAFDVLLGRFPSGEFTVQLMLPSGGGVNARFAVGPRPPQPPSVGWPDSALPTVDYSGMWWNERESGWGLSISQGPTHQLFAVWFVYDAAGVPTWYTLESGQWRVSWSGSTYTGWLYRYTGPPFTAVFDPAKVTGALVGTGVLSFRDAFHGRLDYAVVGGIGSKEITRLPIE